MHHDGIAVVTTFARSSKPPKARNVRLLSTARLHNRPQRQNTSFITTSRRRQAQRKKYPLQPYIVLSIFFSKNLEVESPTNLPEVVCKYIHHKYSVSDRNIILEMYPQHKTQKHFQNNKKVLC